MDIPDRRGRQFDETSDFVSITFQTVIMTASCAICGNMHLCNQVLTAAHNVLNLPSYDMLNTADLQRVPTILLYHFRSSNIFWDRLSISAPYSP